jgi:hypothetical protein
MPLAELTTHTNENNVTNLPKTITPVPAGFVLPTVKAKIGIIYPPSEVSSKFFYFIT